MNTIEDRLSGALRDQAQTFTVAEHSAAMEGVRHRVRRRRRRQAAVTMMAAVAVGAAAASAGPLLDGISGRRVSEPTLAASWPGLGPDVKRDAAYRELLRRRPPKGRVTVLEPAPGGHGAHMRAWVSESNGRSEFCVFDVLRSGGYSSGCDGSVLDRLHASAKGAVMGGGQGSSRGGLFHYGFALDEVRSVELRLRGGRELPGSHARLDGSTVSVWQVGTPQVDAAKTIVFNGDPAFNVENRLEKQVTCPAVPRPPRTGMIGMGGTGTTDPLSAGFSGGCVRFWVGGKHGGIVPLGIHGITGSGGLKSVSRRWWYGVADPATARVELTLADGRRISARIVSSPWNEAPVVLYAGHLPEDAPQDSESPEKAGKELVEFLEGSKVTGYDAKGTKLWSR